MYYAHPNIFITPSDVNITCIHQLAVELKAHALLVVTVVILSLMKNFFNLNSLMFEALNLLVTEECYLALFYMPLHMLFTQFAECTSTDCK
jgi:hypothetical protein